jgi:DNA-binding NarL/FixJ family response regulator
MLSFLKKTLTFFSLGDLIMTAKKVSTLIVDPHKSFCTSLKTLLALYNDYNNCLNFRLNLVGEAHSGIQAISLIKKYKPQLILLDLELNQDTGMIVLKYLQETKNFLTKTLVLSSHQEEHLIFQAMQSGACGYIFKLNLLDQLCEGITTILQDKIYLPSDVVTRFFAYFNHFYSPSLSSLDFTVEGTLTTREKEVLQELTFGLSNEQIAKKLNITIATVKAHLTSIFTKLGVKNRTQAIAVSFQKNLLNYKP